MKAKLFLMSALVLAGCSEQYGDLQSWMNEARTEAKSKVRPVEPLPPIELVTYIAPPDVNPNAFNEQRLKAANSNSPNLNRSKELLEEYSLEHLRYVGSIGSPNALSGLIEVEVNGDKHIYTVKVGNYIGQNYGRISKITPEKIFIVESVEDEFGNWVSQDAELVAAADAAPTK